MFLSTQGLTQVPWGQGRSRGGGRLRGAGVQDGSVSLVVHQAGHKEAVLVLAEARSVPAGGPQTGLQVGVTAGGVTADGTVVSPMGARLEEVRREDYASVIL